LEARAIAARDKAFGSIDQMSPDKPTKLADGTYQGGLLIERSKCASNVEGAPRAYTLGISYEVQPNMHGPAPGNKADPGEMENLAIRQELIQVCIHHSDLCNAC
jgi:hypothetical protein